jgi:hypothetical protein
MTAFTRTQIRRLLEHAVSVLNRSNELRRQLEVVLNRIEEIDSARRPKSERDSASNRKQQQQQ